MRKGENPRAGSLLRWTTGPREQLSSKGECSWQTIRVAPDNLLLRSGNGDPQALAELFGRYRDRLKRMVGLRLDRRLQGRVDPSDVLQEAYLDLAKRAPDYLARPVMPFFLWLRLLTGQRLLAVHRQHLGTQMRDAGQEVSLYRGALPQATLGVAGRPAPRPADLADAGGHRGPRCRSACRRRSTAWTRIDREVLALRHFEELSNAETAQVLGLEKAAASNRYVRALKRLKDILARACPGSSID